MAKSQKHQKNSQQKNYSTIPEHKRQGKKLIPPLVHNFDLTNASWKNERLPEMLWAVLLATHLPRENALNVFRKVAKYIEDLPNDKKFDDVTHTGLSKLPSELLDDVLAIITERQEQKEVLAYLLLFDELPGREAWAKALNIDKISDDWDPLIESVWHTLWHQTQESTDCRWLTVLCLMMAGKIKCAFENPKESIEWANKILYYPNYGDQSEANASVRAAEIGIGFKLSNQSGWAAKFWGECLAKTPCFPINANFAGMEISPGTTRERLSTVYNLLIEHTHRTRATSGVDARHDTVFGLGLYSLSLLQELLQVGSCNSISARTTLRTIVESFVTLAYLAKKDDPELWQKYRVYGTGQAKKVFLKLDDSETESPSFVDRNTLEQLANEDIWQEFQTIDLGHWADTNLRKLSEEAGVKDDYDRFYDWASTFAHGHWSAIHDAVFDTCGNPLHRFHRIPRQSPRALPDVVPDACQLVDKFWKSYQNSILISKIGLLLNRKGYSVLCNYIDGINIEQRLHYDKKYDIVSIR